MSIWKIVHIEVTSIIYNMRENIIIWLGCDLNITEITEIRLFKGIYVDMLIRKYKKQ